MTLLQRFRKLVFIQVMVGILAFTIATGSPALLIIAGMMASMAWYIVEGPRGKALPQWIVMPGALASFGWLMMDLFFYRGDVVLAMGRFTICLQVVMMFGQKRNREYGLILVLGLMQIVAASVLSNSMLFGLLLVVYSFCALLTVLMFHLKATSDFVADSNRGAAPSWVRMPDLKLIHGRGDRGHFRGIALMIGLICGIAGAIIFVTTPRHDVNLLRDSLASMRFSKQVGFSPTVSLTGAPFGGGSGEIVMYMTVKRNGDAINGDGMSWLVRGAALDRYDYRTREWSRSTRVNEDYEVILNMPEIGQTLAETRMDEPVWDVEFSQRMGDSRILFSINPISSIKMHNVEKVQFNPVDQMLQLTDRRSGVVKYTQRIAAAPRPHFFDRYYEKLRDHPDLVETTVTTDKNGEIEVRQKRTVPPIDGSGYEGYARRWNVHAKESQIKQYAETVLKQRGINLKKKPKKGEAAPTDRQIVNALADHLRSEFQYELTNDHFKMGYDPIYEFLSNTQRGHCEMFAAGMAAMARCIGLPARVVSGFRASEFNRVGGYYTIRQDDAHAWAEVYCGDQGWVTVDATPAAGVEQEHAVARNWLTPFTEIYDFIELAWMSSVVNYNRNRREQIMEGFEHTMKTMLQDDTNIVGATNALISEFLQVATVFKTEYGIGWAQYTMIAVVGICVLVLLINGIITLLTRLGLPSLFGWWRKHQGRRLPTGKHVKFYATMLELLRKNGHARPDWQSPYKFACDLRSLDPTRFDNVVPLTELFYEIRFGHREPDAARRKQINQLLKSLRRSLQGG